jgi:glyoxylase-like metal-dependent hydrolase (beta-lactamase superfamily II)
VIFFTQSKVVHMGDQFFSGRFPFVDLSSGGSVQGYMDNVAKVIARIPADAKIIPGHGPLSTLDDLKAFHAMMVETTGLVRDAIKQGKTLEQAKQAGLPDKWKEWGSGFINTSRWIEIIYNSYTAK